MVHGGPFAQYGWTLFDETQVLVSAGYAVVQCNPRGSSGYGSAHGRAIRHGWGGLDADDVVAFLDTALTDPALDADRIGVLGGSYGGYLTTLLIGRTHRFAAAISERAFLDPVSFVGSSDIGWYFPDEYVGTDPARIAAQSALAGAGAITTPTLVIHSEEDWRCPVEQGARLYVELTRRGVPSELLLFPGEGHELSRSGRPKHRLARFEHILRWWARWLPTPHDPGPVEGAGAPDRGHGSRRRLTSVRIVVGGRKEAAAVARTPDNRRGEAFRSWLRGLPTTTRRLVVAGLVLGWLALWYGALRVIEAFTGGGEVSWVEPLPSMIGAVVGGGLVLWLQRRRMGSVARAWEFQDAARRGRLPDDADPAGWGPLLDEGQRFQRGARRFALVLTVLAAVVVVIGFAAVGLGWIAVLVAALVGVAAVALLEVASRRQSARIDRLREQVRGLAARGTSTAGDY